MSGERQYLELCRRIIDEGEWVYNERTGIRCKTVINADFEYNVGAGEFPLVTVRKVPTVLPIAELLGYIRGITDAQAFADLGTKSWFANANKTKAWLNNPNRRGMNDMGLVYGAVAKDWGGIDLWHKVVNNLTRGIDDRGEIVTFWDPSRFDLGCLRPCMFQHHFSLIGNTLHLTSYQRSVDVPLGLPANMQQCYWLLRIMARITGRNPGRVYHKMVNCHIYENQIPAVEELLKRGPIQCNVVTSLSDKITKLEDLETWVTKEDFTISGYLSHPTISIPFSE